MRTKGATSHLPVALADLNKVFGPESIIMVSRQQYNSVMEAIAEYQLRTTQREADIKMHKKALTVRMGLDTKAARCHGTKK